MVRAVVRKAVQRVVVEREEEGKGVVVREEVNKGGGEKGVEGVVLREDHIGHFLHGMY